MLASSFLPNTEKASGFSRGVAYKAHVQCANGSLEAAHIGAQNQQQPDPYFYSMYASQLRLHGDTRSLSEGMATHHQIISSNSENDPFLGNLVTQMYGRCGAFQEARFVFARMHQRDVFTWTFTISASAQTGQEREAVYFFDCMLHEAVMPSSFTIVEVLSACGKASLHFEGKRLHTRISGCVTGCGGVIVENGLLNLYGKCGYVCDMEKVFDEMKDKDAVSWNTMLSAYNQQEKHKKACQLFQAMLQQGFAPNKITLTCLCDASVREEDLMEGKRTHGLIVGYGLDSDVGVANTLVSMYTKCGSLDNGLSVFYDMREPNVVSWTTLIAAYARLNLCKSVFSFFSRMLLEGVLPNTITYFNIILACTIEEKLSCGSHIHAQVVGCGVELDVPVGNALISLYGKCKSMENARTIFDKMPSRDKVSWNSLLTAYAQMGHSKEVLKLFKDMHEGGMSSDRVTLVSVLEACAAGLDFDKGKQVHAHICGSWADLDSVLGSALVSMYAKCGSLEDSEDVFNKVHDCGVVLWTAMISAYAQHQQSYQSIQAFEQMKLEGTIPDGLALCTALSACFEQKQRNHGKRMHACIVGSRKHIEVVVSNALLSMYGRCGSIRDTKNVFKKIADKNVVTWTTMITACAQSGQPKQALHFFAQMQLDGVPPNMLTFSSLLDACASLAALADGNHLHKLLLVGGFEPDMVLGTALVNFYSKCGSVEDADRVFNRMPEHSAASWNSIITAYCQLGDVNRSGQLFHQMQSAGVCPDEITFLSIISSLSHAGLVDEALEHFLSMTCEYGLTPSVEHYNCLIDLFGRAGCLETVEDMLRELPCETTAHSWMSLLSACRIHVDVERGERFLKRLSRLETTSHAPQVLLSNLYAAVGRFKEAAMVRKV